VDETDLLARFRAGSDEAIKDIGLVERVEIVDSLLVELVEDLWSSSLIDIVPVKVFGRLRTFIVNDPLVLGRSTSVLPSRDAKGITVLGLDHDTFLVGLFMFKQLLVRQVAVKGGGVGNAERIEANLLASIGACNGLRDIVRVARFQFSVFDHGG